MAGVRLNEWMELCLPRVCQHKDETEVAKYVLSKKFSLTLIDPDNCDLWIIARACWSNACANLTEPADASPRNSVCVILITCLATKGSLALDSFV